VRHFGSLASAAPTTTAPTSPSPAGTVKSFTEGVLTIALGDGSTVSGKVTEDTHIVCFKAGGEGTEGDDDGGGGDDSHARIADHHGDGGFSGDDDEGDDDGGGSFSSCSTEALVPGAVVLGAELRLGSGGTAWENVLLAA
jgi:hypothetical protein